MPMKYANYVRNSPLVLWDINLSRANARRGEKSQAQRCEESLTLPSGQDIGLGGEPDGLIS